MKDTDFSYAVARIRANEQNLLTSSDLEQLILAKDDAAAIRFLEEKGWIDGERQKDISAVFAEQAEKAWQLLKTVTKEIDVLEFLIVKNDFHNIKAALKTLVSGQVADDGSSVMVSFIEPCSIETELVKEAVFHKKFGLLPAYAAEAAKETYDVLVRTSDGQLADSMLDAAALLATLDKANDTGNAFIKEMAELLVLTADLKIALRAARTGKDKAFLETALCPCKSLDKAALIDSTLGGEESLLEYLTGAGFKEAAEATRSSLAVFEKWCDDLIVNHIGNAKYICLGVEPLIAYYVAKDAEIKSVRIILSCKHNNLPAEAIKERVRKLYV